MKFRLYLIGFLSVLFFRSIAQNLLQLKINDCKESKLYLSSVYGYKISKIDSANLINGLFSFNNINKLKKGIYRVSFNDSVFIDLILNNEVVSIESKYPTLLESAKVIKSNENQVYLSYLRSKIKVNNTIDSISKTITFKNIESKELLIDKINIDFYKKSEQIISKNNALFASKLIKSMELPIYKDSVALKMNSAMRSNYIQTHFFDNIDFADSNLLNTEIIYLSCKNYFEKFIVPATTENYIKGIDLLFDKANKNSQVFCYVLDFMMDAFSRADYKDIYIYLYQNYYIANKSFCHNEKIKPAFNKIDTISNRTPNIIANDTNGVAQSLYNVKAQYTLILFWSPTCEVCEEEIPTIVKLSDLYNSQKFAVYSFAFDKNKELWKKTVKKIGRNWVYVSDLKGVESEVAKVYKLETTPTYVLLNIDKQVIIQTRQLKDLLKVFNKRIGEAN